MTTENHPHSSGVQGGGGDKAAFAAHGLTLAAAPTFATMALIAGLSDGGAMEMLCAHHGASPLTGMATMYLLMSAFHTAPWLKLILGARSGARRPG
jgi:hypothetical protein